MLTKRYKIDWDATWPAGYLASKPPESWNPQEGALDERLPIPWPDKYLDRFRQPFAPWTFFRNALALCNYPGDTRNLAGQLYGRLCEYTRSVNDALFVVYTFPKSSSGGRMEPPWTSAYGNAAALIGLCRMWERWRDPRFLEAAHGYFRAFLHVRPTGQRLWFTWLDDDGYVWFEEMPTQTSGAEPPRVLNGHIRAIDGLFHYARVTRSRQARRLVRAGIYTVERNVERFRRAGQVNSYELGNPDNPDYGPRRTVQQQRSLHRLTGERFFAEMADTFAGDML